MTSPALRVVPSFNVANIPAELLALPQWVCWRYEQGDGPKPKKVPYSPRTNALASVTDRATWGSSAEAETAASAPGTMYDGIGFVLTRDDPYAIIDLDDTEGDDDAFAIHRAIYDALDSYAELSPSGNGLHVVVRGAVETGRRRDRVELYSSDRYMTFTGNVYGEPRPIRDRQPIVEHLWHELASERRPDSSFDASAFYRAATANDDAVYAQASASSNGEKFVRLWNGDGSMLPGGDKSGSAIDMALVNILAFHTKDPAQIERLWRASPQGASRGTKLDRRDYVEGTIRKAYDRELPTLDPSSGALAAWDEQWRTIKAGTGTPTLVPPPTYRPVWPYPTPIGNDEWEGSQSSPPAIIPNLVYRDVGTLVAAGGTGKTTFFLWLAAHVALGIEFCGRPVVAPGNVVVLTAEDSREMLVARLRRILCEMFPFGAFPVDRREAAMAAIRARVIIVDVSASVQRLTLIDRDVVRVDIAAVDALAGLLGPLAPSLLVIDPAVSFGVGETRVNDAEQGLVEAARRLRAALGCAVFYVHHTGKANAREQTEDQYSGRGGSALPDGSRMVFVMNRPKPAEWAKQTGHSLEPGEIGLKVSLAKLSYCEPQEPLYVVRKGYGFRFVAPSSEGGGESERSDEMAVLNLIVEEAAKGIPHSQKTLGDIRERVGLSRDRLRSVVHRLIETGRLRVEGENGGKVALTPTGADASREGA